MIWRVLLAALLAGIAAGLLMGAIQQVRITPSSSRRSNMNRAVTTMKHRMALRGRLQKVSSGLSIRP